MVCRSCGRRFSKETEREKFNHLYSGSSNWDYDRDTPGDLCATCAENYCNDEWMAGNLEADDGPAPQDLVEEWRKVKKGILDLYE